MNTSFTFTKDTRAQTGCRRFVRQQRAESYRDREAQFDEQVPHRPLTRAVLQAIQPVEQRWQQRQKLLVQLLKTLLSSADGAEEGAKEEKVVPGLSDNRCQLRQPNAKGKEVSELRQ
jgi:hypothetical protein